MGARQRIIYAVVGQFVQPRGLAGRLAGWEMTARPSNRKRNLWAVGLLQVQPTDRAGRTTVEQLRKAAFTGMRTEVLNLRPPVVCVLAEAPGTEGPA